jgi:hypothetical protein
MLLCCAHIGACSIGDLPPDTPGAAGFDGSGNPDGSAGSDGDVRPTACTELAMTCPRCPEGIVKTICEGAVELGDIKGCQDALSSASVQRNCF